MADEPGDEPLAKNPKYDQDFFLALALTGKDAWNAWRRDPTNKDVHVTFSGIDFSQPPRDEIDFSGFEFGDNADFSHCRWLRIEDSGDLPVVPPVQANFKGATFGDYALFNFAVFGGSAGFSQTSFGKFANFDNARFLQAADFTEAILAPRQSSPARNFTIGPSSRKRCSTKRLFLPCPLP
jgi:Pentapeptide repeats (9 copies)